MNNNQQRRGSMRENSQQSNKQPVSGYKLSHGVRLLLIVVLGWCSLNFFFIGTGWWQLFAIFPNFLFLIKVMDVFIPIIAIVFIMILYDME